MLQILSQGLRKSEPKDQTRTELTEPAQQPRVNSKAKPDTHDPNSIKPSSNPEGTSTTALEAEGDVPSPKKIKNKNKMLPRLPHRGAAL